jgi:hypothetical protein
MGGPFLVMSNEQLDILVLRMADVSFIAQTLTTRPEYRRT